MSATIKQLLDELNVLRAAIGKAPMKNWKESNAKLQGIVNAMRASAEAAQAAITEAAEKAIGIEKKDNVKKIPAGMTAAKAAKLIARKAVESAKVVSAKPSKAEKPATKAQVAKHFAGVKGDVTVKQLAGDLGIDPRVCRAKLRKLITNHGANVRWVWSAKEAEEIKALLKK